MKLAENGFPGIRVYCQPDIEVVHGPSCVSVENEVDIGNCAKDNVPVHARRGGGGTVVLSPGMVITAIVGKRQNTDSIRDIFTRIHKVFISSIRNQCGINLTEQGLSDLAINNRKVLGSSLYISNNPPLYCYQSSLMVSSDPELMERYLRHPPREPDYRKGRPHSDFCTTLKIEGCHSTVEEIANIIRAGLVNTGL